MLKPRDFNILFETLAAGGGCLLRLELLVKASGLSKPSILWEGYRRWEDFAGGCKIFVLWIRPGAVQSRSGLGLRGLLMAVACGGTQNNLSQSCTFFLTNG